MLWEICYPQYLIMEKLLGKYAESGRLGKISTSATNDFNAMSKVVGSGHVVNSVFYRFNFQAKAGHQFCSQAFINSASIY